MVGPLRRRLKRGGWGRGGVGGWRSRVGWGVGHPKHQFVSKTRWKFFGQPTYKAEQFFSMINFQFWPEPNIECLLLQAMLRALFPRYFPSGNNYNPILLLESNTTDTIQHR